MTTNVVPMLILAAAPTTIIEDSDFFSEDNKYIKFLKDPPYLRYLGWNMLTLDQPKIIDGRAWEVKNGDRKTIRYYRDGTFLAKVYADNSFLGWGQSDEEFQNNPRINPLALIEYVYEFVELYRNILVTFDYRKEIRFVIEIKNSTVGNKQIYIMPRRVNDPFYALIGESGELKSDFTAEITTEFQLDNRDSSKYISFKIISELFGRFGISSDKIPYCNFDEVNRRYIDIDSFPKQ
jgi:hypothetical protein